MTRGTTVLWIGVMAITSGSALILSPAAVPAQQIIGGNDTEIVDGDDPTGVGPGTRPSPWNLGITNLAIGDQSGDDAELLIRNGGEVHNMIGGIGLDLGAKGTVMVVGANSTWNNTDNLYVGIEGSGNLTISDGAVVNDAAGIIGYVLGSDGSVTVAGPGSAWNNSGDLDVGLSGAGTLIISGGGAVAAESGNFGNDIDATGDVVVSGAGSTLTFANYISVGEAGVGTLVISNGGAVDTTFGYIGFASDASGEASVSGDGSSWHHSDGLFVGYLGGGVLTIEGGAVVSASAVTIASDLGASGSVYLEGSEADGRGVLETGFVEGGNGDAVLVFNGGILRATGNETGFLFGFNPGGVTVGAGGAFIDTAGFNVGTAVDLAGSGGLTKQGLGTLVLSGTNSFAGTTTVEAGTLQAASAQALVQGGAYAINGGTLDLGGFDLTMSELTGSGGAVAIGGAELTIDQATHSMFGGALSGTGAFVKSGTGTLVLTGDSSAFAGTTEVSAGQFVVNGALGGMVNVAGGELRGSGTLGALSLGTGVSIAPGNSIGTLAVAGDLVFDPGATYSVEADPGSTNSDFIDVSGIAYLNGSSVAHVGMAGSYAPFSTYTILAADGGINGTFGAVTSDYAFLVPSLSYDANNVYLQIARNDVALVALAATPNQVATASAAEQLPVYHPVHTAIVSLPNDLPLIRASYDALSGELHASIKTALITDSLLVRDVANRRLRTSVDETELAPWSVAFGSRSSADSDGNAAALNHNAAGLLAGVDAAMLDWRLGLISGFGSADAVVVDRASSGSNDNLYLGIYGGTSWGDLMFRSGLAHTWHHTQSTRSAAVGSYVDNLAAEYWGSTTQAFGEAGYQFNTPLASFEPFANLTQVHHFSGGFTETGGAAALTVAPGATNTTLTTLGVRAEAEMAWGGANVGLRGMIGWQQAFGDIVPTSTHAFVNGGAFTVAGAPLARNALVLEAGLDLDLSEHASIELSYSGQIANGAQLHSAKAALEVRF